MPAAQEQDEFTPEQIVAQQLEGFDEAITATPPPAATEDAAAAAKAADESAQAAADAAASEEAARVAAEEAAKEVIPGYNAAAITDALEKAKQYDTLSKSLDKVNGKFGSLEQTVKALQEAKASGVAVQMTDEDVEDLKAEYGPELAAALLKSINKFLPRLGGVKAAPSEAAPADEQAKIDAALVKANAQVDEKLVKTTQTLELKILNVTHPDWRKSVRAYDEAGKDVGFNPEFVRWSSKLPAEDQDKLYNSWDADFLTSKVGEYKLHVAAQAAASKAAAEVKQKTVSKRLATNVEVKSVPGSNPVKSAVDEQREGYDNA